MGSLPDARFRELGEQYFVALLDAAELACVQPARDLDVGVPHHARDRRLIGAGGHDQVAGPGAAEVVAGEVEADPFGHVGQRAADVAVLLRRALRGGEDRIAGARLLPLTTLAHNVLGSQIAGLPARWRADIEDASDVLRREQTQALRELSDRHLRQRLLGVVFLIVGIVLATAGNLV